MRFLPGHWALGLQKLLLVRSNFRAWVSYPCCLGGGRPAFPWGKADSPCQGADSPYQGEMSSIARQRG